MNDCRILKRVQENISLINTMKSFLKSFKNGNLVVKNLILILMKQLIHALNH